MAVISWTIIFFSQVTATHLKIGHRQATYKACDMFWKIGLWNVLSRCCQYKTVMMPSSSRYMPILNVTPHFTLSEGVLDTNKSTDMYNYS